MAGKQMINTETVSNPEMLRKILEAFDTEIDTSRALINELRADHGTFKTVVDAIKTLLNAMRSNLNGSFVLGNPNLGIDTNFDVENQNAIDYVRAGLLKTLAANQTFDTGTGKTIAQDKWSICYLSISDSDAPDIHWNGSDFDDEASAIAATPNVPANYVPIGYVTIKTKVGFDWTAGTDALKGGAGGDVASETNYYNAWAFAGLATAVTSSSPDTIEASAVSEQVERGK